MLARKLIVMPLIALLPLVPAWAATPDSGELSDEVKELAWSGDGPYVFTNVTPQLGAADLPPVCDELQPVGCDVFTLNVNISDEFRELEENQRETVSVGITFPQDPGGQVDYDLYIYDSAGTEVGRSAAGVPQSSEKVTFPLKSLKNGSYSAKVIVYTPLGTDYEGYVVIGKPATAAALRMAPQTGSAPLAVSFDASSLGSAGDCSFDFGDGADVETSSSAQIEHVYMSEGDYLAKVTCSDANGTRTTSFAEPVAVLPAGLIGKSGGQYGGAFGAGSLLALMGAGFAARRRRMAALS